MREIGVGVLGFGLATTVFHAPFITAVPGLRLNSIVQRTGETAAQAYPDATILRSSDALLAQSDIQLVVVATPNETHFALARQALEAGKHVVIDKPFAGTSAQARELIELAHAKSLVLAPFHNRRFDGDFLTVQILLNSGKLGRIATIESHFDRFRPVPREGTWKEAANDANGLLMDLGPHLVDQAVGLFGLPQTITASVRSDRQDSAIEDAFDIALGYADMIFWCRSSMIAADASPRFLIHGTGGSFKKFGLDPQEPALVAGARVPALGSSELWLAEDPSAWGTLTLAPNPAEPASLSRSTLPTEPGDYRR
ncbi:MAG: Gfo/Idh/MocA family oxidoreductase, partial [Janthinobacterium lividum]